MPFDAGIPVTLGVSSAHEVYQNFAFDYFAIVIQSLEQPDAPGRNFFAVLKGASAVDECQATPENPIAEQRAVYLGERKSASEHVIVIPKEVQKSNECADSVKVLDSFGEGQISVGFREENVAESSNEANSTGVQSRQTFYIVRIYLMSTNDPPQSIAPVRLQSFIQLPIDNGGYVDYIPAWRAFPNLPNVFWFADLVGVEEKHMKTMRSVDLLYTVDNSLQMTLLPDSVTRMKHARAAITAAH